MNRQETLDCLDREGIGYELTEHKAVYNMAELAEVDLPYPHLDAKNLFVRKSRGSSGFTPMTTPPLSG